MKIIANIFYVGQIVFSTALTIWALYIALRGLFTGGSLFVTFCFAVITCTIYCLMYVPSVREYKEHKARHNKKDTDRAKMIEPQTDIQQDVDRVEISDTLIDLIVDKMVDGTNDRIAKIDPSDDPSAEYGEYWTSGSYDSDDYLELDEPNDEYCITYKFELSWEYRVWTEYWTDPVCYPSFDDMRNETGYVYDIEIDTPDGDAVKQNICVAIAKKVNDKIK